MNDACKTSNWAEFADVRHSDCMEARIASGGPASIACPWVSCWEGEAVRKMIEVVIEGWEACVDVVLDRAAEVRSSVGRSVLATYAGPEAGTQTQ